MMREKVKNLWKLCFNDSEAFTDLYFRLRYDNDINLTIRSGEEVIAAMQLLPYPMSFCGKELPTAYVSGACTHPDYRGRGVMRQLLSEAFAWMWHREALFTTLIPAEPWLFGYYAGMGYAPVFRYGEEQWAPSASLPADASLTLAVTEEYDGEVQAYLWRKQRERACCVLHTPEDFRVVCAALQLDKGCLCTARRQGRLVAAAVAWPLAGGEWRVGEVEADDDLLRARLLHYLCSKVQARSLRLQVPPAAGAPGRQLGMARVVNARSVLRLYAAAFPAVEANIELTDEQLTANSGYYYLDRGHCMTSTRRLPGTHLSFSVAQLTEWLLAPMHPYMSLMLNE